MNKLWFSICRQVSIRPQCSSPIKGRRYHQSHPVPRVAITLHGRRPTHGSRGPSENMWLSSENSSFLKWGTIYYDITSYNTIETFFTYQIIHSWTNKFCQITTQIRAMPVFVAWKCNLLRSWKLGSKNSPSVPPVSSWSQSAWSKKWSCEWFFRVLMCQTQEPPLQYITVVMALQNILWCLQTMFCSHNLRKVPIGWSPKMTTENGKPFKWSLWAKANLPCPGAFKKKNKTRRFDCPNNSIWILMNLSQSNHKILALRS